MVGLRSSWVKFRPSASNSSSISEVVPEKGVSTAEESTTEGGIAEGCAAKGSTAERRTAEGSTALLQSSSAEVGCPADIFLTTDEVFYPTGGCSVADVYRT